MAAKSARRSKFTQSMSNHIFRNIDGHMAAAVVNGDSVSDHLGENRTCPAPGPDYLLFASIIHNFNFMQ
jgi:hypothetical protein